MTEQRTVRPARERKGTGIAHLAWIMWPWMNWLLPIAAILVVGNSGWFLLLMLLLSPVLVLALGLLGTLPRFLLGNAGWTTAPAPVAVLLFVQWWAWITALITPQGGAYGRPIPSVMQWLSPRPLAGQFLMTVLVVSVAVAVVCWVTVLILAIVLRHRSAQSSAGRGGARAAVVAAIMPAVLLCALIWGGGEATAQQRDEAGTTVAEVQAEPVSVQAARALQRYESAQSSLSDVRGMLADDGWRLSSRGFVSQNSSASGVDRYAFDLGFEYEIGTGETVDLDAVGEALLALGWTEGERGRLVDPDGNAILMWADSHSVSVSLTSPSWWGDPDDLSDELDRDAADSEDVFDRTYAYDEWPAP